eukprot:gene25012-biopygen22462
MARAWRGHVLYRGEHNMSGIERVSNACHRDGVAALAAAGKQADRITGRAVARRGSGEHHASQMGRVPNAFLRDGVAALAAAGKQAVNTTRHKWDALRTRSFGTGVTTLAAAGKQADRITGHAVARRGSGGHHPSQWDAFDRDGEDGTGNEQEKERTKRNREQRNRAQWDGAQTRQKTGKGRVQFPGHVQFLERGLFYETRSQNHKNGTRSKRDAIRTRFLTRFERVPGTRLGRVTMCP